MPRLYIISGCNGAGKTTASFTVLPELLCCTEFVNADEIAKGISPFHPEKVAIEAGRLMLHRIRNLIDMQESFAFETTLATRSYLPLVKQAQTLGYHVTLLYFWLSTPELALRRVEERVRRGGHAIDRETVCRRYHNGIRNLIHLYTDVVDYWVIIDNSVSPGVAIAEGFKEKPTLIHHPISYNILHEYDRRRDQ